MERVATAEFSTATLRTDEVHAEAFDFAVWFCGYERRSPWLVQSRFRPPTVTQWFHVEVDEDRDAHDAKKNLQGAETLPLGGKKAPRNWDAHWGSVWRTTVREAADRLRRPVRVFVDISSMPRAVYGPLLIEALRSSHGAVGDIILAYVPGAHQGPISGHQHLDGLRTLAGLEGATRFDGDPALILGLGFDGVLADTVVDLFQLEHVSCLYADPGVTEVAVRRCIEENSLLLGRAELVERASVGNLESWLHCFDRLVSWYRPYRDVMLLPIGPKPQVVAAILYALKDPWVGFRCLRTSRTTPIQVEVPEGAEPHWMRVQVQV